MTLSTEDEAIVAELLPAFIAEAEEQVASFEQLLLRLEESPADPELLDALFRCAHTVKGSAGVFGLDRLVGFTHHVETLLDRLRDGALTLTPELSTLLLQANDVIRELVAEAHDPADPEAAAARAALVERLQAASGVEAAARPVAAPESAPDAPRRVELDVRFGADTFRHGLDPLTLLTYVGGMGRLSGMVCDIDAVPVLDSLDPESCHLAFHFALDTDAPRSTIVKAFEFVQDISEIDIREPVEPARPKPESAAARPAPVRARDGSPTSGEDGSFIRVHANRLDTVINLLGELVIACAGASQLARRTRQRELIEANEQITRLIEGIRNSTLKLRMVPIGETFSRFRRVVRDTAAELGKDVSLQISGGETELDKAVVERIADPLMHLVRNALDHGLETEAQRVAAGKPAQGRLSLSACHESGSILIRIADDGRGIQRDKVLERAWQRGLIPPGSRPPDDEILELIFEPGFSTAETVTNLSGRGVGMDVVRRNIEALRGSVMILSEPGQGSCIEIRLPLTLAIIDGFLVGVGASRFVFPLDTVVEVVSSRSAIVTVDERGRGCIDLRGRLLPVIDLRRLYALDPPAPERTSIVVVRSGTRHFGVQVDSLLGQHQTVIKPLGRLLGSLESISGSTILGTGEVALIFDVDALGQLASGRREAFTRTSRAGRPSSSDPSLHPDREAS